MARKDDNFDLGFDDLDMDLDFDLEDDKPLTRIQKVKRAGKGFRGGVIEALTNRHTIAEMLGRAIPSEYGIDTKLAVSALEDLEQLTERGKKEGAKVGNEFKRALLDSQDDLKKFLPPKMAQRLLDHAKTYEREPSRGEEVSPEDAFVANRLGDLFGQQEANESAREEREVKREDLRTRISAKQHIEQIEVLDLISRTMDRVASYNDNITAKYQRKSLEIGLRHYFIAAQTLAAIKDNSQVTQDNLLALHGAISKPEVIKLSEHETTRQLYGGSTGARSVFGSGSGVVDRLRANAGRRLTEMINTTGQYASMAIGMNPLAMTGGMITPNQLYEMGGAEAGKMAVRFGGGILADQARKRIANSEMGKRLGGKSRFTTQNFRRILEERFLKGEASEFDIDENGNSKRDKSLPLIRMIRDLIGDERGSKAIDIDNVQRLQEPHPFTRQTNRTINEVIPGLLSSIQKEIVHLRTGVEPAELVFDFAESRFISKGARSTKVVNELLRQGDGDLVKERTKNLIDSIDPEGKLSPELRHQISLQLLDDNYNNRLSSVERLSDAATFKGMSPEDAKKAASAFASHFHGDVNQGKINDFSEGFNSLLSGVNINRDQVQGLVNTGDRRALEDAGILKDGMIDQRRLMELFLSTDFGSTDSSLIRQMNRERSEKQEEEARLKERAQSWKSKVDGWRGKGGGVVRGAVDDFNERAKDMYDHAQAMYRQSGLAERVSDLSNEAIELLDKHGISLKSDVLSDQAKQLLAKHGLLEKLDTVTNSEQFQRARKGGRRMSRRARQGMMRAQRAAGSIDPTEIKRKATSELMRQKELYNAGGIKGLAKANADQVQAVVSTYLSDLNPKEISEDLIKRATDLAMNEDGSIKTIEQLTRDINLDKIRNPIKKDQINEFVGQAGSMFGTMKKAVSDRLRRLKIEPGQIDESQAVQDEVQADAIGESVGERFKSSTEELRDAILEIKQTLIDQYQDTIDRAKGPRKGSYEDQMANKSDEDKGPLGSITEKHDEKESGFGLLKTLFGAFSGGLGGLLKLIPGVSGILGMLPAVLGAGKMLGKGALGAGKLLTKIPGVGKALGAAGSLLGKIPGAGIAKTIFTGASKATLWGATKAVGKGALWAGSKLLGGAGTVARMLPLLASPAGLAVVAGGAAIAGAGYLGYKAYKWFTRIKPTKLNNYRMIQYGFGPDDGKNLRKIAELEGMFMEGLKFNGNRPTIDYDAINWKKVFKHVDVNIEDRQAVNDFERWVLGRFGPVFVIWAGVTKQVTGSLDFEKAEDLKDEKLETFIDGIKFLEGDYTQEVSDPFTKEPVVSGKAEVKSYYDILKEWANKRIKKEDKEGQGSGLIGKVGKFVATGGLIGIAARGLGGLASSIKDKLADTALGRFAGGIRDSIVSILPTGLIDGIKGMVDSVKGFFVKSNETQEGVKGNKIDAFDAIRYRMYGLKDLQYDRVTTLIELEREAQKDINYRKVDSVEFTGNVDAIAAQMMGKFGVTDQNGLEAEEWKRWFNRRFLPVFVNACAIAYKRTREKTLEKGLEKFNRIDTVEAAKFIIGTMTQNADGDTASIWTITNQAWPDLPNNTNPETIKENMDYILEEVGKNPLPEDKLTKRATPTSNDGSVTENKSSVSSMDMSEGGGSVGGGSSMGQSSGPGGMSTASGGTFTPGAGITIGEGEGGAAGQAPSPTGNNFQGMKAMLEWVAKVSGVDFKTLSSIIAIESGFDPNARPPIGKNGKRASSAVGLGQFLDDTWDDMLRKYGHKYGLSKSAKRTDPVANALMTAEYIKENLRGIKNSVQGRELQPIDAYMGHFLGLGGYRKFLSKGMGALGADVLPDSARSNESIFYAGPGKQNPRTVGQILALFNDRLTKRGREFGVLAGNEVLGGGTGSSASSAGTTDNTETQSGGSITANGTVATSSQIEQMAMAAAGGANTGNSIVPLVEPTPSSSGGGSIVESSSSFPAVDISSPSSSSGGGKIAANGMPIYEGADKVQGQAGSVSLAREQSTDNGTFGIMTLPDGTRFHTLELPWKNNEPRKSCIPPGTYQCEIRQSPKFGTVYEVKGVPGRSAILFHAGNSAGDSDKGMKADSLGCILIGYGRGQRGNQQIITNSREATKAFNNKLGGRPFTLVISGGGGDTALGSTMADAAENPQMSTAGASSPFSATNPFEQMVQTPAASQLGPSEPSDLGSPDSFAGSSTYPSDFEPSPSQSRGKFEVHRVFFEQLDTQRRILAVLEATHELMSNMGPGMVGLDDSNDSKTKKENAQSRSKQKQKTDTPKPVITYST